ncbi:MAG: hypothetical protein GX129_03700 [Clostridiales bacterium]|jgi:hypothetical protein|nr:hypothetical protein [Clostridiales bacterium]
MGWLGRLFGKSNNLDTEDNKGLIRLNNSNKDQIVGLNSHTDRKGYIKENSEIIAESYRQIEESKVEYQAVTSYLTDMQKIDRIPTLEREAIEDAARNILNLSKERNNIRNRQYNITDIQYRLFEQYEMQLPKELTSLKEAESYQDDIEGDIDRLEKEKQNFLDEQNEIINKQSFLKGIAKTTFVVILVLFAIFALLSSTSGVEMTLPFLMTVLMGMGSALYIFMEARKNAHDVKMIQLKLNKVIMLANKVAIKSVNNRNYLDYCYSKYMVVSYEQLKKRWEQYIKIKDENKRFESNSQLLEFYNDILIKELKKYKVTDSEIWIYQPSAILDSREMVEVRHRLNVRRQKLRERIQANKEQQKEAAKAIMSLIKAYPDSEAEAISILKKYKIKQDVILNP